MALVVHSFMAREMSLESTINSSSDTFNRNNVNIRKTLHVVSKRMYSVYQRAYYDPLKTPDNTSI